MRIVRAAAVLLLSPLPVWAQSWSTTLRTEAKVLEESNVFLQDEAPLAAGQTVRACAVRADDEEFVAALGILAARKPATAGGPGTAAELGYTWEEHRFSEWVEESHRDHRFLASFKTTAAEWVVEAKGTVLEVDGSETPPVYNERGGLPAMAGEPVRSRRAQTVTNATAAALWQPTDSAWRVRPNAVLLYQDFHTHERTQPYGCVNYVDRGQGLWGVDAGRALRPDATAWLSIRAGRQWQSNLLGRKENFTSDLLRPLVGFEGVVRPGLKVSAWAGPTFHHFTNERRAGSRENRTIPYFETTTNWTATAQDTITLSARHHLWLGSSGRSAYRELKAEAGWLHKFVNKLEAGVRAGWLHGDFGGFAASERHDSVYTVTGTTAVPLPHRLRAEFALVREWSDTRVPYTEGREYHRWLTSVALSRTW